MCGIITVIAKKELGLVGKEIINQYQMQYGRGTQGFGLMEIFNDQTYKVERATEPTKALLDCMFSKARIGMFHHRMPTSTTNEIKQTHPFIISHDELAYDYGIEHNGVISNAEALFKIHTEELGYRYKTLTNSEYSYGTNYKKFNDSEALAIEIARYLDGISTEIGTLGSAAFVGVRIEKTTQKALDIFWGRNDRNPLEFLETENHILIASTIYEKDALEVEEFTIEMLNIKTFLKNKIKNITDIITVDKLQFKKVETIPTTFGFGASHTTQPTTSTLNLPMKSTVENNVDDDEDENYSFTGGYKSEREEAFEKMGERIIAELEEDISQFFYEIAYEDVDDSVIQAIVGKLESKLIEKRESANEKVRPFFDFKEDQEKNETYADIEEDVSLMTVNERATASARRFEEIHD